MKTEVIFRTFRNGDGTIALFPYLPGTNNPADCLSYMHFGQHGAADPQQVVRATRPATAPEATILARELRRAGYKLRVLTRTPSDAFTTRRNAINATKEVKP